MINRPAVYPRCAATAKPQASGDAFWLLTESESFELAEQVMMHGPILRHIKSLGYNLGKVLVLRFMTPAEYSKDRRKDEL